MVFELRKKDHLCPLCGNKINDELLDREGAHLICSIECLGGCEDETGLFLSCDECWKPCPYRQSLPVELEALKRKKSMCFGG